MAQKAKLDILDIPLDKVPQPEKPPADLPGKEVPAAPPKRAWHKNRLVLAGGLGALAALLTAAGLFLWHLQGPREPSGKAALVAAGVPAASVSNAAVLQEFYLDVRDAAGKPRLAVVGVVLEPADPAALPDMNRADVRKAVHAILSGKTAEGLRAPKEREALRKEVAEGVNQALGRAVVRAAWFSDLNVW